MNRVIDATVEAALRQLADAAEQRRLWLSTGGGREVSSLTESISQLWDDSGLGDALESGGIVYSVEIDEMFEVLWTQLKGIDDRGSPDQIIADPRMVRVRAIAAEILARLSAFGYDRQS